MLTDGTGASEFVRELVKNYLYLAHHEDGLEDVVLSEYSESLSDQERMDLKDIIHARQTEKKRKNRQRISFAETGVSLEVCRRQRQKFRSKN